ncbi:MAG: hypothetical protein ABEN55_10025, partial [Bradymonadaceae bacterium]
DELVQGLADAINNENLVNGRVEASADTGNDVVTITARHPGIGFTYTEVADPSDLLSHTRTQQNQEADPLPWGRAVEDHGDLGDKLGRLVDASHLTPRELHLSVGSAQNSTTYTAVLLVQGERYEVSYTSDADAPIDEVVNGLASAIDGQTPEELSANGDTTNDDVEIVPETAGFVDFVVLDYGPDADLSYSIAEEGDNIRDRLAGVALAGGERLIDPGVDVGQYPPNTEFDVKEDGAYVGVAVEEQPSQGDPVYVRLSANGQRDQLGAFRASWDSGCVPLPEAEWVRAPSSDVAAVEVP